MELLTAAASLKLGQSALKLVGAAVKAVHTGDLADIFDLSGGAAELAGGLTEAHRVTVASTVAKAQRRLERGYKKMLEREGADWALRADVKAVFLALPDVLDRALPDAQTIVAANLDTARIATLVADMAAKADSQFAQDQIGRRILVELVSAAYDEVKQDQKFAGAFNLPIGQELLTRTERIDKLLGEIKSRVGTETHVPIPVLTSILAHFGDTDALQDPGQIEARLRAKASEYLGLRERLNRLTANDPRIQPLRRYAADLIASGKFEDADFELEKAEQIDSDVGRELEVDSERHFASAAVSRAERGAAARLRRDYRAAAAHYSEAASIETRDSASAWGYCLKQADSLYDRGVEFGDNAALREAIAVYGKALRRVPRERVPLDWATTLNGLGNALSTLGDRENGTARLEEAVAAYRAALEERTRERAPLDWARTQNNLGNALSMLGEREEGTVKLEGAVAAYRAALKEFTSASAPLQWATTQTNLGTVLTTLGGREVGAARLEEAVAAYNEALKVRTRARAPLDWAQTQNNLGNALTELGEREGGTKHFEAAVAAYQEALKERTRELVPLPWAGTENNLGRALTAFGEREGGTARLIQADEAFSAALEERTPKRVPLQWAASLGNQGIASAVLADRERDALKAEKAVKQIETAYAATQTGGQARLATYYQGKLATAQAILNRLKDS